MVKNLSLNSCCDVFVLWLLFPFQGQNYVVIKADMETTIIAFIEKWKNCIKNICQKKSFSLVLDLQIIISN